MHAPLEGRHYTAAEAATAAASSAAASVVVAAKVIAKPKPTATTATAATAPDASPKQILRVQMLPLNDGAAAQVSKAGLNPLLQLNVPASFTLSGMLRSVIKQRWAAVVGVEGLRLQPPSTVSVTVPLDCPAGGWGVEDGQRLNLETLHRRMGHPTPFQLTYTLPGHTGKPQAASQTKTKSAAPAAPAQRAAAAAPLPSLPSMRPPAAPLSMPLPAPISVAPLVPFPLQLMDDPAMAMMRFVISQSADAQQLYSSLLAAAAASPALNLSAASSPNDENSQAPAAMIFNPMPPVAPPAASRSRLPPSTFRAGEAHIAARRAAALAQQHMRPVIPATFGGPFVSPAAATAPSAPATEPARSKKQRLSFGSADSGVHSSLHDEQQLLHKQAFARSSAAHALSVDDDPSLPALPTSHSSFPVAASAAASSSSSADSPAPSSASGYAAAADSFQDLTMMPSQLLSNDELEAFFGSDEIEEPVPAAAAAAAALAAPALPPARGSSLAAAPSAPASLDPFACTPGRAGSFGSSSASATFGATGRSSSVKKSLFPSFMAASPATAALSSGMPRGGVPPQSQRNIFEANFRADSGSGSFSSAAHSSTSTAASLTADRAAVIAAAANAALAGSDLHLAPSSSSSSSLTSSSLSSSRPPLATLFSCSEASALNISNNLSASLPLMTSQLQQRSSHSAAATGLSHTAPPASSASSSYASPVRRSQTLPGTHLGFHPAADKENAPHHASPSRGVAKAHAALSFSAQSPTKLATAHAALSFSIQSPSKLAMNGWHGLTGGSASASALSFAAPPAGASTRQSSKLRPSSVQLAAAASSHALSTPRGSKGAKGSSTVGSGGSSASGAKKRSRDPAGAGGSGGTKGSSSGNGNKKARSGGSGGGKSNKKPDSAGGSGGKSASAKKRKQSSPSSAASSKASSKAASKAASVSASASGSATKKTRTKRAKIDSPAAAASAAAAAAAIAAAAAAAAADDDDDFDLDEWAEELDRELSSDGTESERPPQAEGEGEGARSPGCASSMASPASGAIHSATDSPRTPRGHTGGGINGGSAVKGLREMDSPLLPPVLEMSVEVSMDSTMHQASAATQAGGASSAAAAAAAANHSAAAAASASAGDPLDDPLPSSFFARHPSDSDPFPAPAHAHSHTDWLPAPLHPLAAGGAIDPDQQHAAFMAMFGEGMHESDESAVLSESHYTEHQMQMHHQAAAAAGHATEHAFSSTSPAAPSCSPGF